MAWRFHGRAKVNPRDPRAFAVCDDCGFWYNLQDLSWQYEWAGPNLVNRRNLVCQKCQDDPNPQLRSIVIPQDPPPVLNARPERSSVD